MNPKKPLRKVSKSRERMLSGESGKDFLKFNSTIRRDSCQAVSQIILTKQSGLNRSKVNPCDAIAAGRNFRMQEGLRTSLETLCSAEDLLTHVSSRSSLKCGTERKPIKNQSKRQKLRLRKLAAVRLNWWTESQAGGKPLICGICDEEIQYFEDLASDHIEPGSAKSDSETNLQPSHNRCNFLKGSIRNFKIVRGDHNWKLVHGLL